MSKETNWVDKKAQNNIWLTPSSILDPIRNYAPIKLDPCTESNNPVKAAIYYDEAANGLVKSWDVGGLVFVNPPYSKTPGMIGEPPIRTWAAKIHEEAAKGVEIIALLPCGARFSTKYWQAHILNKELSAMCFVKGRIKFINGLTGLVGKSNNYDSMLYGYNVDTKKFAKSLGHLGSIYSVSLET